MPVLSYGVVPGDGSSLTAPQSVLVLVPVPEQRTGADGHHVDDSGTEDGAVDDQL